MKELDANGLPSFGEMTYKPPVHKFGQNPNYIDPAKDREKMEYGWKANKKAKPYWDEITQVSRVRE